MVSYHIHIAVQKRNVRKDTGKNMGIQDYVIQNYILLIACTGILTITIYDVYLDRISIHILRWIIGIIISLSVIDYMESWFSDLPEPTTFRILFSVLGYTLRPTVIMLAIFMIYHRVKLLTLIPAILNALVYCTAFFSDIAFSYSETNNFLRGPLGYTFIAVGLLYVLGLCVALFKSFESRHGHEWLLILYFVSAAILTVILTIFFQVDNLFNMTFIVGITLYYLHIYIQHTKLDALTGLFNRQVFYTDIQKNHSGITGVISIDMNNLKILNDTEGHSAGDKALKTLSECFLKNSSSKNWIYRIGGDEFVIFCIRQSEEEMQQLLKDLRDGVAATEYSCSFGLSVGTDPNEMLRESDRLMYEEKARYKAGRI